MTRRSTLAEQPNGKVVQQLAMPQTPNAQQNSSKLLATGNYTLDDSQALDQNY